MSNTEINYKLNPVEYKRYKRFVEKHNKHPIGTCDGGQYSFTITYSSIGTTLEIECNECGADKNLTDFSHW